MARKLMKSEDVKKVTKGKGHRPISRKGRGNNKARNIDASKHGNYEGSKDVAEPEKAGSINDSSYYYNDANVLSQIGNFSFNQFNGIPVDFPLTASNDTPQEVVANIMAINLNPCVPQRAMGGPSSGTTNAAMRNYLVISSTNNKSTIYAPQDPLILQLALAELIKIAVWIKRALGVSYLFNYRNRDYPNQLLKAMGIDGDDMRRNLAQYRVRYNTLLNLANAITFPGNIPCFAKAARLYAAIYTDSDNSALAQTYILNPETTWLFDEAYNTQGSGLRTTLFVDYTIHTLGHYLDIFENMISALLNSSTLNAIYSDIMRLSMKGEMNAADFIRFESVEDNYVCPIGYNDEIALWLHNMIILNDALPTASQYGTGYTDSNDVSCDVDENSIVYNPQFKVASAFGESMLVDYFTDQVNEEMKVASTRLSARYEVVENSGQFYTTSVAFMDEYVTRVKVFSGTWDLQVRPSIIDVNSVAPAYIAKINDILSKFDWSPLLYWTDATAAPDILKAVEGDLNYYTLIDYYLLKRMYDYEVMHFYQIG